MGLQESPTTENKSNEIYGRYARMYIAWKLNIQDESRKDKILKEVKEIIDNLSKNNEENDKFYFANKIILELQEYASQNELTEEFEEILWEHSKDVFIRILNWKEVFSWEEQVVNLKDETNSYVEKTLKSAHSNAYKYEMWLNRLKAFVKSVEDEEKKNDLESLVKQIEDNKEDYLKYSNDFVEFLEKNLEEIEIDTSESKAIVSIFKEVRDYNTLAHRVRWFHLDEASKEGLEEAINQNISELEFDIRFSKDWKAIIHHNASMWSSANRKEYIKDLKYPEIKDIELKNWGSIIDLKDFFEIVKESWNKSTIINIDIKDFDKSWLDHILDLIKEYKFSHRVKIVSWSGQDLQYMYEKRPDLHYSLSYHPVTDWKIAKWLLILQDRFKADWFLAKMWTLVSRVRDWEVNLTWHEIIKYTRIENPEIHYSDSELYTEWWKGYHPMVAFDEKWLKWNKMYERILYEWSVNIMSFDWIIKNFPDSLKEKYYKKMKDLISKLKDSWIDTNIFDIKDEEILENYFDKVWKKVGTVYSSNENTQIEMGGNWIEELKLKKTRR